MNTRKLPVDNSASEPQLYIPPSHQPSHRDDFYDDDKPKIPLSQRLGGISDGVFGFVFNPNIIKFGILLFAGFCVAIDLAGYYDLVGQMQNFRLDEFGRQLPVDAPVGPRIVSALLRIPVLGGIIQILDGFTGGLFALVCAISIWFVVQGLEVAARFNLYFPDTAENLLYKQNRKRYERPGTHPMARKAYRMATTDLQSVFRLLAILGVVAYILNAYAVHLVRPWVDTVGNPLWSNISWNVLAVAGVEVSMLLHKAYKSVTLSNSEKADKDRLYN